ncbi:hypothetical protein ONZ43_g6670 [Nemania bipapillata]|uniref:Uncharacterized protein n=1 Tax=Nemania bipapillata TaxID=110536 RepID=A0ACC2HX30_9PEZI|nr:hypothetical protein ONZ43_g6670 [Nemania bipapillata]
MYALTLTAELNGNDKYRVTNLRPKDIEASPFWYTFMVQCTSCRETHSNAISVSRFEVNELSGSRGEANFGEWLAEGTDSGTKFEGIELQDGEWFDYDEKANDEVSIKDLKWEIRRA